ncbi:site-specific integrase [Naasia sp. SYSU D00948]|uniref:tyrosine-type recombinase/integrase n=1 Tax=Naasia sp. SYSU D00948 TaxID=2817379 RepID=UPI001B3030C5|nr:site-specific integrase [Naasia sp. SYSU D00948]
MSGRPRTDIGTFGDIRTTRFPSGQTQAVTRFRDWDGRLRRITATGSTKAQAIAALKRKAADRDRARDAGQAVTADTPFPVLAQLWLEEMQIDPNLSDGTKEVYERRVRNLLLPALEHFTLREITVARLERFLKAQAAKSYATAKQSKVMLNLLMRFAMRHEAIRHNPMAGTTPLRKPATPPKALTLGELQAIRHTAATRRSGDGVRGPKPDGQLGDIIEVMLGSSARIGEALALRRCDVDMTASPPTVRISGTVVVRRRKGVFRQATPKTNQSNRTVAIPQFAAQVIRRRLAIISDADPEQLLFFSRTGSPLTPYNVRRTFRRVLEEAGLGGRHITPHSFRRTVATLISQEASDEAAAAMLGHGGPQITRQHYIERKQVANPVTADILEKLAPYDDVDVP